MAIITFPNTPAPSGMTWRLIQPAQNNISGWTGARQVLASGRGWWECSVSLPPMVGEAYVAPWRSFFAKLQGTANDFRLPVNEIAQSSSTATPLVNGGSQTGRSIATDGWPLSSTVLSAGMYVTINNQLLQLTADVVSNGSGQATISVAPAVRTSPANDAPIEYKNPFALVYMLEEPTVSVEPGLVYSTSFSARESF